MRENPEPADVLFEPLSINALTIANRIIMGPMAVLAPEADGRPSDQTIAFLCERARGGVGLIILGGTTATRRAGEESPVKGVLRLEEERFVPDLKRLTDAVHACGTPIIAELSAGFGPMAKPSPEWPLIAASPKKIVIRQDQFPKGIKAPGDRVTPTPREATVEEIHRIEHETAETALRCQRAGFDGVEVAAHMSYFLASFLSSTKNERTDEYGGSIENRARILVNIVRLIREQAGASYPIGLRISANEHVDGGQGPEEYAAIAHVVERESLDYVALSDGNYESMYRSAPETDAATVEHGEAQVFRAALSCPLILGATHDPRRAAQLVAEGHADAVMFARPMIADPNYANKVRDAREHEIVRCDRDNVCMRRMIMGMPVRCTVNPRMGRESRAPGERPPIRRIVKAPIERAVLSATGSERLMSLAGKAAARKRA
jgi:2,4-dienoyl-CoA reductase-like NADH-dependent reductase (Old Yellow Enzyme family)